MFVLIGFTSTAQIVNIPDPNFKNFLINNIMPAVDVNLDGQIQVSEAAAWNGAMVIFSNSDIADLTGIEAFTSITALHCGGLSLTTFNPTGGLTSLRDINISSSGLTSLDLSALTNLKSISFFGNDQLSSLNLTGLVNLEAVICMNSHLTALNLDGLTSLVSVNCSNNNIESLNVTGLPNFTTLYCPDNNLSSLTISNCPQLHYLYCGNTAPLPNSSNHFTTLDLGGFGNLTTLYCGRIGNLATLNLDGCSNLQALSCDGNLLTSLDLSDCINLKNLTCPGNQLTSLNLSGFSVLETVNCSQNALTNLTTTGCTALTYLDFTGNQVSSIDVSNNPVLTYLSCGGNQLASIDLSAVPGLTQFLAWQNSLTTVDISACPLLTHLDCRFNQLTYANLKNGSILSHMGLTDNANLQYVCTDDNETSMVQAFFTQNLMPNVNVNSYCSFTPGGSFNTLTGTVKVDVDNNGCTASDPILPGLMMKINDGTQTGYTSSNTAGVYSFYTNAGNFTVTPQLQMPYYTISPASAVINFAGTGDTTVADFCLIPNGVHNDIDVTLIPVSRARPGFDAIYQLVYKNKGTTVLSGNVDLNFDDARMNFLSATPAVTTQNTGVITWAYSNLLPFESRTIDIQFNLVPPPVNNIDDTLTLTTNITPLAADQTPMDNSFALEQVITGSMDPNDKSCLEGSRVDITRVGDYVHYLVRFQNTGNEAAENVVVKDMLETNFDWNSFELTKTSHPCIAKQTDGNKLEFIFEGINLPAVTVDEPASHGFIAFKVRTIGTLVIGDSLKNNAAIYFDYNLPVITNTAASRIDTIPLIPVSMEYFKGNIVQPGKHNLNWKASCTGSKAIFTIERSSDGRSYSSIGNITASNTRCLQPFDHIDNNPVIGMNYYRIKMTDDNGKSIYSSVVALLNKKTGFEIVNLLPNPVTNGTATLNITSAEKQTIKIIVTDATGKTVKTEDQSIISGFTQVNMNFANLASGTYSITVYTNDGERKTKQFIKQ